MAYGQERCVEKIVASSWDRVSCGMSIDAAQSEAMWLALAEEFQEYLRKGLDSLGGKLANGVHEHFKFYAAVHINNAVAGYLVLKKGGMPKASVLLIRPALESLLRLVAVHEKPELITRIAHEEYKEEKKLLSGFSKHRGDVAALEKNWKDFKSQYTARYSEHLFSEDKLTLRDVAESAGLESVYLVQYRLYCKHTHGALRAMVGGLDNVGIQDSRSMAICALSAIEVIRTLGASAPDRVVLDHKFNTCDERTKPQD